MAISAKEFQERYEAILQSVCLEPGFRRYEYLKDWLEVRVNPSAYELPKSLKKETKLWLRMKTDILDYARTAGIPEARCKKLDERLRAALTAYEIRDGLFVECLFQADEVKESKAAAYQRKYHDLLQEMCSLEPDDREAYVRGHVQWTELNLDIMNYVSGKKDMDADLVFQALLYGIRTYQPSKGLFFSWVYYKNSNAQRTRRMEENVRKGGIVVSDVARVNQIMKLLNQADLEREITHCSEDEMLRRVEESCLKRKLSKAVIRKAIECWRMQEVELEGSYEGKDGEGTFDRSDAEAMLRYEKDQEQEEQKDLLNDIFKDFLEMLKNTAMGRNDKDTDLKRRRRVDLLRCYITREILKEMKFRVYTEAEKGMYLKSSGKRKEKMTQDELIQEHESELRYIEAYLEKMTVDARHEDNRIYYRWVRHQANPEERPIGAGEEGVYLALSPYERELWPVLRSDCIKAAILDQPDEPESLNELYGVYYNLLKPEFQLSDKYFNDRIDKSTGIRFGPESEAVFRDWSRRFYNYVMKCQELKKDEETKA